MHMAHVIQGLRRPAVANSKQLQARCFAALSFQFVVLSPPTYPTPFHVCCVETRYVPAADDGDGDGWWWWFGAGSGGGNGDGGVAAA